MKQELFVNIGYHQTRGGETPFFIDAFLPTWLLGKSRTGKSSAMLRAIVEVMRSGNGCIVNDPHGPLVDAALGHVPEDRLKDVIVIDLRAEKIPGIGIFSSAEPELSLDGFINIVEAKAGRNWGPQSASIMRATGRAVLERYGNPTIVPVYKALAREAFARELLGGSKIPLIQDFYNFWYSEDIKAKDRMSAFAHPLNKIDELLRPGIREVVAQKKPLKWEDLMDSKKIIFLRLPKGEIGKSAAEIIGALAIFNILLAAPRRKNDNHFVLFIDEIHNFLDGIDFELMLAEIAKWHITPFFATQTMEQMRNEDRRIYNDKIALGNIATLIAFRVSGEDAKRIALDAGEEDDARSIVKLQTYTFQAATVLEGIPHWVGPISSYSKIYKRGDEAPKEKVLAWTIQNAGSSRADVARQIDQELALT